MVGLAPPTVTCKSHPEACVLHTAAFFLAVLGAAQGRMLQIGVKAGFLFICIMHDTRSFLTSQLAFICFYYMSYL